MDRHAFLSRGKLTVAGIVLAPMAVIAFSPSAFSAERVVLMEQFTATWCAPCNAAAPYVGNLIDTYGANGTGTFAVVEYHTADPPWGYPWGEERWDFYNAYAWPTFWYDGVLNLVGYPNNLLGAYQQRLAIPTPVTMSLEVDQTGENSYRATIQTCVEADADPIPPLNVYSVMMEDHWPPNEAVSRNTFRWVATTAPVLVRLDPGECETVIMDLVNVVPLGPDGYLKAAAWAQEFAKSGPAEVYQAAITAHPFAPPCPWDCMPPANGIVNVSDFLAMLSQWGLVGRSCDFDNNGVNVNDFLVMLAHWGPCPD